MPPNPAYVHGSDYHQRRRWIEPHTLRCLETAIDVLGSPTSLVDVGCAEGALVQWARYRGIDAVGIDLAVPDADPSLVRADLQEPVDLGRTFQWVLCWEVAEHLPESAADHLCQTLVRHMEPEGRLIFTAARPGQRGPGHINCQRPSYWLAKFAALGVELAEVPSAQVRQAWRQCAPETPWYGDNVLVLWMVA